VVAEYSLVIATVWSNCSYLLHTSCWDDMGGSSNCITKSHCVYVQYTDPSDSCDTPFISLENCLSHLFTKDLHVLWFVLILTSQISYRRIGMLKLTLAQLMGLKLIVDVINYHGLEQFINAPTWGNNVLDFLFCSHLNFISSIEITSGISDLEAIFYCLDPSNKYFLIN